MPFVQNATHAAVWKRLKKYCQKAHDLNSAAAWQAVSQIRAQDYTGNDPRITTLRALLRRQGDFSRTNWHDAPPHSFMPLQAHCLRFMEERLAQVRNLTLSSPVRHEIQATLVELRGCTSFCPVPFRSLLQLSSELQALAQSHPALQCMHLPDRPRHGLVLPTG